MENIGPDEARAALAQVGTSKAAVRRWDLDRIGLIVLSAVLVGYSFLSVALADRQVFPWLNLVPLGLMVAFGFWRERNGRVYSRTGKPIMVVATVVSMAWFTLLTWWIGPSIGWVHGNAPDWHFIVISFLSVVPLLAGAWLIGRLR